MHEVKSIMAGSVWQVVVNVGDQVEKGQDVVIIESMKMEIPITTEKSGTVKEVVKEEGDFVNEGDVLVIIE